MTKWFTQEIVEEATIQMYDRSTNTIEVDKTKLNAATELFDSFGDHATEAAQRHAQMTGKPLLAYGGGFDSDTSSND